MTAQATANMTSILPAPSATIHRPRANRSRDRLDRGRGAEFTTVDFRNAGGRSNTVNVNERSIEVVRVRTTDAPQAGFTTM